MIDKTRLDKVVKAAQTCSEVLIRVGVVCGVLAQILAERSDELSEPSAPESAAQPVSEKSEEIKAKVGVSRRELELLFPGGWWG